jgi:hypothetical protein
MRYFFMLFALLFAVMAAHATAPANSAVNTNYVWELDTTITDSAGWDTLNGDDSIVVCAKFYPKPGYEYILVTAALTEGSEAEFILNIACLDEDGDVLYVATAVDTLADDGGAILLPFGESLIGTFFRLVIVDGAADVGENLLNTTKIYRRHTVLRDRVGAR